MTELQIRNTIESLRTAEEKVRLRLIKFMEDLQKEIDEDLEFIPNDKSENADSLASAITCYISYNEYNLDDLVADIMEAKRTYKNNE